MGTIIERKRKNGTTAYLAQISISRAGKRAHSESRTFDRRPAANAWIKKREKELAGGETLGANSRDNNPTLSDVIDRYIRESRKAIGRTKAQVLASIKTMPLAEMKVSDIRSRDVVDFARVLQEGRTPSTVGNYLSHLASIFTIARPAWGVELEAQVMKDAQVVNKRMGFIGKSRQRNRRPTLDELDTILSHFEKKLASRPRSNPMVKIAVFALFSTRRQDEICRICWPDLDRAGSRVLVRDMKNPGDKSGNDVWVDLPAEAMMVIDSMPMVADEIFPFNADAISAAWTRAGKALDIEDLHFHDLRHEGISRLFEMGLSIPRVAAVSGHRSWVSLKGYTHLNQVGDKYAGWTWVRLASEK